MFSVPLEAAWPGEPKAGMLPVPPVVADAKHQPGVPNVGGLSAALPAFEAGAQSATLGDLWELLLVPKAGAFACPDAEGGAQAAPSAILRLPLLMLSDAGTEEEQLPWASALCNGEPAAEAGVLAAAAWESLVCPAVPLESPVPKEKPVGTGLEGAGIPPV